MSAGPGPIAVVERLRDAINAHDLDRLVGCFAPDFHCEQPAFPHASFIGYGTVRRNWAQLLAAVPDISADIVRWVASGDSVWAEWQQRGTQKDGRPHLARGVVIFTIASDRIASNRFYVFPVRGGPPDVLDG